MQKNTRLHLLSLLVIISLPLIYLAITYNSLPATVPLHFNASLEPNRFGDKSQIWISTLAFSGISVFLLLVLRNLPRLDPKRKNDPNPSAFNKMSAGLTIILTALNFILILSASRGASPIQSFLFPLLGLLFAFLGNYMHTIKPNYFAGFRLPWTLSDDDNWRKTHRLAGKLWFWAGIAIALLGLFIPTQLFFPAFTALSLILGIIPAVYSYRLFKHKQ